MSRAEWLAYRMNGIGGSEVGTVLGLSPYTSSLELYYKKIQPTSEIEENEAMHWGKALEDLIAERWQYWDTNAVTMMANYEQKKIIRKCRKINAYIINPDVPYLFASVDRIINHGKEISLGRYIVDNRKPEGVLEIKTISGFSAKQWEQGIPPWYITQLQSYLLITGLSYGEIALLRDGRFMEVIPFQKSEIICNEIISRCSKFWSKVLRGREILANENVTSWEELRSAAAREEIAKLEPEPDGSESYEAFLSDRYKPEQIEVKGNDNHYTVAQSYIDYNEQIKEIEEKQRLSSNVLKVAMAEAEVMSFGDRGKVLWKTNSKGSRVFTVKLKNQ